MKYAVLILSVILCGCSMAADTSEDSFPITYSIRGPGKNVEWVEYSDFSGETIRLENISTPWSLEIEGTYNTRYSLSSGGADTSGWWNISVTGPGGTVDCKLDLSNTSKTATYCFRH
jgi:hypothetical protein